jgi:predicted amidophosphoribosyltransferase
MLTLLAPPVCLVCRLPGADLCSACRRCLPWLADPLCPRCGLPEPCGRRCPAAGAAFARSWAPLAYAGSARALVLALKRSRALAAIELMAAQLAAGVPRELLDDVVLVPIPAHPERVRGRGFDQADRLAGALASRTGLPRSPCLRRAPGSARQAGASRAVRLVEDRLAIEFRGGKRQIPPRALLVDDVHTTGATLRAGAAALRRSGSVWVGAVTYARTVPNIAFAAADKCPLRD